MKKNDIMPGGKYFPIFWFEIFGAVLLIAVIMLIIALMRDTKTPGEILYPEGTTSGALVPGTENQNGEGEEAVPTKHPSERTNTENLQRELLDLYFSGNTKYGMEYRGGYLTSDGFADVFMGGAGTKISVGEVRIGDYAVGNGITGICVGFYDKYPVFAYMSEYTAAGEDDNGMCLGFSREQNDELFFGMFPVTYTEYYRVYAEEATEDIFPARVKRLVQVPWYVTDAYEYGKHMSNVYVDYLIGHMLHEKLSQKNLKLHREKFTEYLTDLPYLHGFEGTYDVMVSSVREKETYTEVTIRFMPHVVPGIQPMGEWKLTFYPKYDKFLPCGVDIAGSSEVGFVREKDITITTDESGNVTVEREEIIYGQTVDENGKRIYRLEDGTVIYLDP